jgi:esterase/lipase superfamily enzyme
VPIEREPGSIPRPGWFRLIFDREDPARDFTLAGVEQLSSESWRTQIQAHVKDGQRFKGQALIFIHGFNVSFDDALFRTAQISHDIGFDGVSVLYSWPSRGNVLSYVYDLDSAKAGRAGLKSLMEAVAATPGVSKVNVIAHSLGNDPLLEVLREHRQLLDAKKAPDLKLNELVFAAPDVSRSVFEQLADRMFGVARGITLYASSNDRALMTSHGVRGGHIRAGEVPPGGPVVVAGI